MTVSDKLDRVFLRLCGPSRAGASPSPPPHASSGPAPDKQDVDPERSSSDDNQSPHKICGACQNIDFDGLLDEERAENELGPLTNHLDEECSFCNLLFLGVQHHWGEEWTPERLCGESEEIPTVFVQSRSPLSVKQRGHIEYPHPRILVALDVEAPGFSENRRVIREIDRVKNRHIIAEIESVHHEGFVSNLIRPPLVPRREVGADVDIELIKSWLHDCKSHEHTFKAQEQMEQGKVDLDFFNSRCGFRLLDVEEECLVLKTEPCAFAALSYVWGRLPTVLQPAKDAKEPPILLCTKDNLDRLSAAGGLSSEAIEHVEHARLPQTITDAIEFSRRIGMRYLWVDTLCIVQDDPSDKCYLIQAMDNIYDIATVTYIAISGKNADAGLGGISPRKGRPVDHIVVAGREAEHKLSLSPPSLNEEVRRSTWDTRGWTFQEQALSQRCLYFTPDEIFFNCIESIRREAYNIESTTSKSDVKLRTGPPWWNRKLRKDPDPTPYRYLGDLTGTLTVTDYQLAVQAYSRRTLSFPEDVLTAFEGVFNRFSRRATCDDLVLQQTQGIPVEHMHQALLWFPSDETVKRLDVSDAPGERFSSWSWYVMQWRYV